MDVLKEESRRLAEQKRKLYGEYQRVRRDMQEVNTAKANIDYLLGYAGQDKKKEQERETLKIMSKATLPLRASMARGSGFGAGPNKRPPCHLWPRRNCLPFSDCFIIAKNIEINNSFYHNILIN